MNKLLAEEYADGYGDRYDPIWFEFYNKKFTELVVQECCGIVNKHVQWNNTNDCLLVLDIKEHFGIEE
jgi:hypothetical protein